MPIDWSIDVHLADEVAAKLRALAAFGADMSPAMAPIANTLVDAAERAFADRADPATGAPWPALKSRTGQALQDTGRLAGSIHPNFGPDFAEAGTNVVYAEWQQQGTDGPYVILPRNKQALFWPGAKHPVKKVVHPGLPPRPFLGVGPQEEDEILQILEDHIAALTAG